MCVCKVESGNSDVDAEGKLNDLMNYSLLVISKVSARWYPFSHKFSKYDALSKINKYYDKIEGKEISLTIKVSSKAFTALQLAF